MVNNLFNLKELRLLFSLLKTSKSLINDMKTFIKFSIIIAYLGGLGMSIIYSIFNPRAVYRTLSNWGGDDILTTISAGFLVSGWILIGIVIIWMIVDKIKEGNN